jgi:uncharacterized protein (TIGR02271 family)
MSTVEERIAWRGHDLIDANGDKVGRIEDIYVDTQTNQPEWAVVKTGLFGNKQSFVPLHEASPEDEAIRVPFEKDRVKDAPRIDPDGTLSREEEAELYQHYGVEYGSSGAGAGAGEGVGMTGGAGGPRGRVDEDAGGTSGDLGTRDRAREDAGGMSGDLGTRDRAREDAGGTSGDLGTRDRARGGDESRGTGLRGSEPEGRDLSGPETDDAMTRSEEELRVGTAEREAGRARLRKHVVSEEVRETVPLRREEARVERESITDENRGAAADGPPISDEEHEVVLLEEEPVVEKRVVPKERVRLDKDTHVEEREIREEVRREEIDVDDGGTTRDRPADGGTTRDRPGR